MPKASDLNLADPTPDPESAQQRDMFVIQCRFLLDDDRWTFAWDTVSSLQASVEGGMNPTERMWQALKNIEDGGRRRAASDDRYERLRRNGPPGQWSRRYEGR